MPLAVSQTPTIGAEIRGIDLSHCDISQENVEWLEAQLVRHKVIFFRDQNIDPAAHLVLPENSANWKLTRLTPRKVSPKSWCCITTQRIPHQEPLFGTQTLPGEQSLLWVPFSLPARCRRWVETPYLLTWRLHTSFSMMLLKAKSRE